MATLKQKENIVVTNPDLLPESGIICAHPGRVQLIAQSLFKNSHCHTNYRGFQIYVGNYKEKSFFVANTGIGAPAAAFLIEELLAYGVKRIVRIGSNDQIIQNENQEGDLFIVQSSSELYGLMRDYGYATHDLGKRFRADRHLSKSIYSKAKELRVDVQTADGYHIDSYYSHFSPERLAMDSQIVKRRMAQRKSQGLIVRDMETAALFMMAELRGFQAASVLVNIRKHDVSHEMLGRRNAIEAQYLAGKLVLETLID